MEFGLIDEIVTELTDWKVSLVEDSKQQTTYKKIAENLMKILIRNLKELSSLDNNKRMELRFEKFRKNGQLDFLNINIRVFSKHQIKLSQFKKILHYKRL